MLRLKSILEDCRRYHCLPSQLDDEDYHLLELLRAIDTAETQYNRANQKARQSRPKRRR